MFKSMGMPEFYQESKREKLKIIDVREISEYEAGHIPGSLNLPLSGLGETYTTLKKEKEYYLICQSGGRSAMAGDFLGSEGFNVTNILGGMGSWPGDVE